MKKFLAYLLSFFLLSQPVFAQNMGGGLNNGGGVASQITSLPIPINQGGTGSTTSDAAINAFNTNQAITLPNWRKALTNSKNGVASSKVLCVGDSTTRGFFASGSGSGDQVKQSFCSQFTQGLQRLGYNAVNQNFFGLGKSATSGDKTVDARFTIGSWTGATNVPSLGGASITAASAATASFAPTVPADTCDIWYLTNNAGGSRLGTFSYNVDGGSSTNVVENVAKSFVKVSVAAPDPSGHVWNINWVSNVDGGPFVQGFDCYNSTEKQIDVINAGFDASSSTDWVASTASPWDPAAAINALQPSLVIIDLGINDWVNGTSVATYKNNMQTLITSALNSGAADVVLVSPNPSDPVGSGVSQATQQNFVNTMAALAVTNNIMFIDEFSRIGTYAAGVANGYYFNPGVFAADLHLISSGYGLFAADLIQGLVPQTTSPLFVKNNVFQGGLGWTNTGLSTSEENLVSVPIPLMGPNDQLRVYSLWTRGGTLTDTDNLIVRLSSVPCTPQTACSSGSAMLNISGTTSSTTTLSAYSIVTNRNSASSQVTFNSANVNSFNQTSGAITTFAQNTGAPSWINFDCTTATSSADSCKLEAYSIEILSQ